MLPLCGPIPVCPLKEPLLYDPVSISPLKEPFKGDLDETTWPASSSGANSLSAPSATPPERAGASLQRG